MTEFVNFSKGNYNMLDKIKSIKNNLRIGDKLEELKIKQMSTQIAGFFKKIYGKILIFCSGTVILSVNGVKG